jgi:hypothetical protein
MVGRKRCRLHGGKNYGPKPGSQHGLIHGRHTRAAKAERKEAAAAVRAMRDMVKRSIADADAATAALRNYAKRDLKD